MKYGKITGMSLFVCGLIILLAYGLYQDFKSLNLEEIDIVIGIGVAAVIVGLLILFVSIVIEQQKDKKKMKEEIKKEDLEP